MKLAAHAHGSNLLVYLISQQYGVSKTMLFSGRSAINCHKSSYFLRYVMPKQALPTAKTITGFVTSLSADSALFRQFCNKQANKRCDYCNAI